MKLENFHIDEIPEQISKNKLRQILGVSAPTLYAYANIACYIPDFANDYPRIHKNGLPITKAPLTRYQSWVIYTLLVICRKLPREEVETVLATDANLEFTQKFAKENFDKTSIEIVALT